MVFIKAERLEQKWHIIAIILPLYNIVITLWFELWYKHFTFLFQTFTVFQLNHYLLLIIMLLLSFTVIVL